ncbi:hypothetical protein AB0I72_27360 [Nocardiopsis sp. NPDC049922]|uniref:hypothetical protein n=1 Tax=Nocardiopsis sp. NPDC049922 TaxID=3155157 RepID=UPI0033C38DE4
MTSEDLAREVNATIAACQERVVGVGNSQYSYGDTQRFEEMPFADLVLMAREEVQDLIVYAVMTDIRLKRLQEAISAFNAPAKEVAKYARSL